MKVVQIGCGSAASLHRQAFPPEVEIIAVVDADPQKVELAKREGFPAFSSILLVPQKFKSHVDFWDVCVPNEEHLPVMRELLHMGATKILVEKPICVPSQIKEMKKLLDNFPEAQVCVEETYLSSTVVEKVREKAKKYQLISPHIIVEKSKNRINDVLDGRFLDPELGVFGLETPHSVASVIGTGIGRAPSKLQFCWTKSMDLPSGHLLPRQGSGSISYLTKDGCQVKLLTSMDGNIIYPLPEINAPTFIPQGDPTRYRIIVLEEGGFKIIGQFEPIPGRERFRGRVLVYQNSQLLEEATFEDKPMNRQLARAIRYFQGQGDNPGHSDDALAIVSFLGEVMEEIKKSKK